MSHYALLGYIAWTTALLLTLGFYRSGLTLSGKRKANSFSPSGEEVSAFANRLCRAHANCYEAFPIVGGLLIYAIAAGKTEVTDPLAIWVLAARIGQSLVHLASTSIPAVLVRFVLFVAQIGICVYWLAGFVKTLSTG